MEERNVLEILGKNMHDIRFEKNISMQELAEKVSIDIETLRKFEAGESTGLQVPQYIEIANALGVGFKEITNGIEFVKD